MMRSCSYAFVECFLCRVYYAAEENYQYVKQLVNHCCPFLAALCIVSIITFISTF